MAEYTKEQLRFFDEKDRRINRAALVKSYVEHHGKLPPIDWIEQGLELIYGNQEEATEGDFD